MRRVISKKSLIGLTSILVTVFLFGFAFSSIVFPKQIPSSGKIKTIDLDIYWDAALTNKTVEILWGFIEPDSITNVTVYVKSRSNVPLKLSMVTESWSPSNATSFINCSWNREGYILTEKGVIDAIISLEVSPNIAGIEAFSFNFVFVGTG